MAPRFFARSLRAAQDSTSLGPEPDERERTTKACLARLDHLEKTLPSRFQPAIQHVTDHAAGIFNAENGHPWVTVHGDLSLSNILVSKSTGRLTGVVDLAELSLLPFGFDFCVIDELAGEWHPGGWVEHANAQAVRDRFWSTLLSLADPQLQNIKVAWLAGILFRYGTRFDAGFHGMLGRRNDATTDDQILDGLVAAMQSNGNLQLCFLFLLSGEGSGPWAGERSRHPFLPNWLGLDQV